jgi:hypothetical protein
MSQLFSDRVTDVAEKTGGFVLFDVRVDGDSRIQRMAAIGFGEDGAVAILMDKNRQVISAPISGDNDRLAAELAAWATLPMGQQACVSYGTAAANLLSELRKSGQVP